MDLGVSEAWVNTPLRLQVRMSSLQSRLSRIANLDSPLRTGILACLVTVLSYLAARVGGALVLRPQMVWPLWPGCALLVAVLLLVPRKVWPIFIAAGLAGFVLYDLQAGLPHRSMALLILADTVEILIAALGVSYSFAGDVRLNSVESLAKYSFFAVFLAPVSAAFVGAAVVGENYWAGWRISYFTESLALLTLTPAILTWGRFREAWPQRSRAHYLEAIALIAGLVPLCYIAFVASGRNSAPVLLYSLLPFLLWSALRFGLMGISTTMIIVDVLSTWGAVHGGGPFTGSMPLSNVLSLQLFLFFAATPFMVLAVLVEERKRAEQATRESEERFRLVADTAPALIWMSTVDKLCCYFNKPWLDFTGRSIGSELGNGWADGIHPEDFPRCMDTYARAFDRREEFRMEYRLRRYDGEYRWVLDIGVPRFNPDDSFTGYIGSCIDVTEQKRAEDQLQQAQENLARVTRVVAMGELAAAIAHEVNQPLTAIVTNSQFCLRRLDGATSKPEELRSAITAIVSDSTRASGIISRIRGLLMKGSPDRTELDINRIILDVTSLMRKELTRNRVSLRTELAYDLAHIRGDPLLLQQVLINLIMNAIEATHSFRGGRREILIRSAKNPGSVLVQVQDSGPGIAPGLADRIFEPFFTTKAEGIGMGLSISHSVVESHGGHLRIVPSPTGALFVFTLPTD